MTDLDGVPVEIADGVTFCCGCCDDPITTTTPSVWSLREAVSGSFVEVREWARAEYRANPERRGLRYVFTHRECY